MLRFRLGRFLLSSSTLLAIAIATARAEVPSTTNYQGVLSSADGIPLTGNYAITFSVYAAASGGTPLWSETHNNVSVTNGVFALRLGSVAPFPVDLFSLSTRYLGIAIAGEAEMTPRQVLTSAPFAMRVGKIDGAGGGTVYGNTTIAGYLTTGSVYTTGQIYADCAYCASSLIGVSDYDLGDYNTGVQGVARYGNFNTGVYALANEGLDNYQSAAVYGVGQSLWGGNIWAAYFDGWANVTGNFYAGGKFFRIDDPENPSERMLTHACVESSEYKNMYDGVVMLDENGEATVALPAWFEKLNGDFRYQLTCVGGYAPVYVAEKINDGRFAIAGGTPGLEVSWQVTGVRQDAYAKAHPIQVIEEKKPALKGKYLHPAEYGQPETMGIDFAGRHAVEVPAERPEPEE